MIKALADVIEKVRLLGPEQQAYAAGLLEKVVGGEAAVVLSDDERALVEEGLRDVEAGRIVPDDEMAAFWQRLAR